ncbi:sensor histidine kinase [Streptacidiphilus carbonis]|uniref:sensor histidine kinase n=1 Tax=Streptacidiphilus carbonis TaxID=105422 RepID=UPI0005A63A3B|nr:HAMP domain-containing sensor histidine kinase [Streptacidiphilus carbonis]
MRLATRIALVTAVIVPVLVLLAGLLLLGLVGRDLRAGQDGQLRDRAAAALPYARTELHAADAGRLRQEANQQSRLGAAALDVGVRLTAADGTVLLSQGAQPAAADPLPAVTATTAVRTVTGSDGTAWRALAQPIPGTAAQPGGTLWLFARASAVQREVRTVRGRIVLIALVAAPLGGLLAYLVAERAAGPLRQLRRRTSGLDPDDPATRLRLAERPTRVVEVDELAGTLQSVLQRYDEQAARTAEALATARAFAASASHELRTPLMSMRTNLDVLTEHPGLAPEDRAEILADLQAEHARLLGTLTALRALAQGDLVEQDAFGPVDLGDLVESAAADARRRDPRALITVRSSAGSLRMHGWEPGLRMAVDNLLANALVHGRSADGTARIELALGRVGTDAVLTVADHGPGIPPDLRDSVFDRFRRGPDSPGSGLGLTLVAQQTALHRGTVRFTEPPPGTPGALAELRLPLAASAPTLQLRRDWLSAEG